MSAAAAPTTAPGEDPRDPRQRLGLLGERIAARWLERRGWSLVGHRFRSGHRDLDLIVRQGSLVAFVEVKARRGGGFGGPLGAVHWRKRRELVRSAQVWIARHGEPGMLYRFDVIGVLLEPPASGERGRSRRGGAEGREGIRARVRHVADAFQVPADS
jgi:putative endonuclease